MQVFRRKINADTVGRIIRLSVTPEQRRLVASDAVSLAEALFPPEAWYRAVYADASTARFVTLYHESLRAAPPAAPDVSIGRFMIDADFQRRGVGAAAIEQVVAHVRGKGLFSSLSVSYVPGSGCPEPFYLRAGFKRTGAIDGGEIVLAVRLAPNATSSE